LHIYVNTTTAHLRHHSTTHLRQHYHNPVQEPDTDDDVHDACKPTRGLELRQHREFGHYDVITAIHAYVWSAADRWCFSGTTIDSR